MAALPECPPSLKSLQHYLKTAAEHDARDPVVAYWCRLHALQLGMKVTTKKTPEETKMLMGLMDWLEEQKKTQKDNEAISNDVAAQAHLDNYALKLFLYADKQDREQNYGKNVVKAFYTAGMVYDVLTEFGELSEEAAQNRKYAKWKAAYIHNCLKSGETPVPGPMPTEGEDAESGQSAGNQPAPPDAPTPGFSQPNPGFTPNAGYTPNPGFTPTGYTPNPGFTPNPAGPTPPAVPTGFGSSLPDPSLVNRLPPVPYTPEPNPGGFVSYTPAPGVPAQPSLATFGDGTGVSLTPEQITKAQKYCKWASSALNYEDFKTAVANLNYALQLLTTGRDPA